MIKKFRLHNFRTFLNTEIEFQQRHLIIGKNNSGKTNLMTAVRFLGATSATNLSTAAAWVPGGMYEMRNWQMQSDTIELGCTCLLEYESQPCEFTYDLSLRIRPAPAPNQGNPGELSVAHEKLTLKAAGFESAVLLENDGREATTLPEEHALRAARPAQPVTALAPQDATMFSKLYELPTNRRAIHFRKFLSRWSYYLLNPESMRYGWRAASQTRAALDPHGNQLANVVFHLKNFDELRYRKVIDHTRILEPELVAINFVPVPDQAAVPFVVLEGQPRASWVGLSDGTLRGLALAYIIETASMSLDSAGVPAVSLIEELENGIHPGQLRAIFDLLEEQSPSGQFILSSHSPLVIDLFEDHPECVTILKKSQQRTQTVPVPVDEVERADPDRLSLAEKYALELIE